MEASLEPIVAALANLDGAELLMLAETTSKVSPIAPGMLAWIEAACDWELSRRFGTDYPLFPPRAAIPPEEEAVSVDAVLAVRAPFGEDDRPEARAVLAVLDAIVDLITGERRKH